MTTNTNKIMLVAFAAIAIIAGSAVASMQTSENQAVDAIKKLGITEDEIRTSSFSIYPIYDNIIDPKTGVYVRSELSGYRVTKILSVKTKKLTLGGEIINP